MARSEDRKVAADMLRQVRKLCNGITPWRACLLVAKDAWREERFGVYVAISRVAVNFKNHHGEYDG